MERDAREHRSVIATHVPAVRPQYHSSLLHDRLSAPTPSTEPCLALQTCSAQEQLASYLRSRGFPPDVSPCVPPSAPFRRLLTSSRAQKQHCQFSFLKAQYLADTSTSCM
jgi:hypothetical protein